MGSGSNTYKITFVTPGGKTVGTTTVTGNPDIPIDVTTDVPDGYKPKPGQTTVTVTVPKGQDPNTPIIVPVVTPAGATDDGVQVKEQVPTDTLSAHQYTVNFVTPNGKIVGTTTVTGNPDTATDVTKNVPDNYGPKPGQPTVTVTVPDGQDPATPITVPVVSVAGGIDDGVQVKEQVPTDTTGANKYTVIFVTPIGQPIGSTTVVGQPGDKVTPTTPDNGGTTPGQPVTVTIPKGQDPNVPIIVTLTTTPDTDTAKTYTVDFVTPDGNTVGTTTFTGKPGNSGDITPYVPAGYEPAPGQDGKITIPDNQDPKTPIVVTVTPTTDTNTAKTYTINFVTPNGETVGTTTFTDKPGTSGDITPYIPAGYEPAPGQDSKITIPDNQDPKTPMIVNVTTTPDTNTAKTYTVTFVTTDGKTVGTTTVTGKPGTSGDITPYIPAGYVPAPGQDSKITIPDNQDPQTPMIVNVTTTPDTDNAKTYTVTFVTTDGKTVGTTTVTGKPGNSGDITPGIPDGYVPTVGNDGKITIPDNQDPKTPIVVTVTPTTDTNTAKTYTVTFVTPNGKTVGTTTVTGEPGNNADITPYVPDGYVPTPGQGSKVTIPDNQDPKTPIVVTVTPTPDTKTYTVTFVTTDGKTVGTTTVTGKPGNSGDVTPDVPDGYVPAFGNDGKVTIPDNQDPQTPIVVTVTPDTNTAKTYTVTFVTTDGKTVGTTTVTGKPGNSGDITPDVPDGYVPAFGNDGKITIPDNQDPKTPIVVTVTPDTNTAKTYTVTFVTTDGKTVGTTTVTGKPGNSGDITPDVPDGYVPAFGNDGKITIPDNQDPKTPIVVTVTPNTNTAKTYTITFVTTDGKTVGTTTVTGKPGNSGDITPDVPDGYVPAFGNDGKITIPDNQDPKTPIVVTVTPNPNTAKTYTITFVTPDGKTVGTTTVTGQPGNSGDITPYVPAGYVPVNGKVMIPDNQNPETPIVVAVVPANGNGSDTGLPNTSADNPSGTTTPANGGNATSNDGTVPDGDLTDTNTGKPVKGDSDQANTPAQDQSNQSHLPSTGVTADGKNSNGQANTGSAAALADAASAAQQTAVQSSAAQPASSDADKQSLPSTGEQTSPLGLIGGLMMAVLGLFGLAGRRRKQQ